MTLVLDASVVVRACGSQGGFDRFGIETLLAPPLMWSEVVSVLHVALWRGQITPTEADRIRARLKGAPVRERRHRRLFDEAWRIAEELGWAKTSDAEYLSLARLVDASIVTLDRRLSRGAARLGVPTFANEL